MKTGWKCSGLPRSRWVCFFIGTNLAWHHLLTSRSSLVNGCHQNEIHSAKFLQNCSYEEKNSFTSWMAWRWVHFQQFHFWWTIPLTHSYMTYAHRHYTFLHYHNVMHFSFIPVEKESGEVHQPAACAGSTSAESETSCSDRLWLLQDQYVFNHHCALWNTI